MPIKYLLTKISKVMIWGLIFSALVQTSSWDVCPLPHLMVKRMRDSGKVWDIKQPCESSERGTRALHLTTEHLSKQVGFFLFACLFLVLYLSLSALPAMLTWTLCVPPDQRSQERTLDALELDYGWLWAAMRLLGAKLGSFARQQVLSNTKPSIQSHLVF